MNKIPQYNNIRYISITSPQCSSLARGMYPILSVEAPIVILAQSFQELNSDRSGRINSPVL